MDRFAREGERIAEERVALVRQLLLGIAVAIAITAAAFFYVRASLTVPLGRLVAGITSFGPGKLHARIDSRINDSRDEIGQVARAFNGMAGEIEGLGATLEQRVEQRTTQLEAANKELEAFAYSVSHDLRSPLRAIDGFSLALLEDYGEKLDDEGKDSLRRVRDASQRMGHLIDDMLELSRATRGETTHEVVDLSALAQATAGALAQSAPERRVTVRIEPGVVARSDGRLLRAVMDNLLSNAWKFTAKKDAPTIEFGAERKDGEVVCHVRDDGAGFDMAYIGNLFAPFQRLHGVAEFPGNGIGLATVRRVIARLGGRVWAEGAVGQGRPSTFHCRTHPRARRAMVEKKFLLVEDNPDDEKLTLRALARSKIANTLVVARDGAQALEALLGEGAQDFGLVLLDLKLPRLPGLEVLARMRKDPRTRLVPVVILTSSKEESDLGAGYGLGANSYIRKPVDFQNFADAVAQLGMYWLVLNEPPPKPAQGHGPAAPRSGRP